MTRTTAHKQSITMEGLNINITINYLERCKWVDNNPLPPSSHTLLRSWIRRFTMNTVSLLGGFEQAANSVVRSQRNNRKTRKWTTPKRVRIRPKYSATSLSRDRRIKMEQNKKTNSCVQGQVDLRGLTGSKQWLLDLKIESVITSVVFWSWR